MSEHMTDTHNFHINGIIIDEYDGSKLFEINKINELKLVKQPNSTNRFCYCFNEDMKKQMRITIEKFYDYIREYFDEKFIEFKLILGFITINSTASTNGVLIHRDKTDYTFNMFLNDDYEGGTITFTGKSDKINKRYEKFHKKINDNFTTTILPKKNKIIFHRGYNAHQVEKVISGIRYNLILWCYESDMGNDFQNEYNDFII
jgi:hypothetical protein